MNEKNCAITTFYQFASFLEQQLAEIESELYQLAEKTTLQGLVILGTEGINSTLSGSPGDIERLKEYVRSLPGCEEIVFKDSEAPYYPFRRFKVKVRDEIVTLERKDLVPAGGQNNHLAPSDWHEVLSSEEDYVLIDTRNDYETELGMFRGALDPKLKVFSEFGEYVKESGIPRDKKVLMYCTGGIRCEKAILEMQSQGYENVYQLEGGILKYLEEFPEGAFEGECFVFDHRVSVDTHLQPSKRYRLCPHCGNPAGVKIECGNCQESAIVCAHCLENSEKNTCSKNCSYHYGLALQRETTGTELKECPTK